MPSAVVVIDIILSIVQNSQHGQSRSGSSQEVIPVLLSCQYANHMVTPRDGDGSERS